MTISLQYKKNPTSTMNLPRPTSPNKVFLKKCKQRQREKWRRWRSLRNATVATPSRNDSSSVTVATNIDGLKNFFYATLWHKAMTPRLTRKLVTHPAVTTKPWRNASNKNLWRNASTRRSTCVTHACQGLARILITFLLFLFHSRSDENKDK